MSSGGESLSSVRPFGPVEEFVAEAAKDSSLEGGLHLADVIGGQIAGGRREACLLTGARAASPPILPLRRATGGRRSA